MFERHFRQTAFETILIEPKAFIKAAKYGFKLPPAMIGLNAVQALAAVSTHGHKRQQMA